MAKRPPYLPTKEQRDKVLAALGENATYGEGLDAVERLTVQAVAEYLERLMEEYEAEAVVERFIAQGKAKSE